MQLRNELDITAVALVAVQVLTSFAAIGLLVRMSPVVERVLDDNVASVEAVEDMLGALAVADAAPDAAAARFGRGLARARANVTESEEAPLLARIDAVRGPALLGDPAAREAAVAALAELSAVNRRSVERTDTEAQRLGYAGAWTAAGLGVVSFVIAVAVSRRLVRRVEQPLAEIDAALLAARRGDTHRRVNVSDAPEEVVRVAQEVNDLLDLRCQAPGCATPPVDIDRAALLHLLEGYGAPAAVLDAGGTLRATNAAARDRLAAPDGADLRRALTAAALGDVGPTVASAVPIGGGTAVVCVLAEAAPARAAEG